MDFLFLEHSGRVFYFSLLSVLESVVLSLARAEILLGEPVSTQTEKVKGEANISYIFATTGLQSLYLEQPNILRQLIYGGNGVSHSAEVADQMGFNLFTILEPCQNNLAYQPNMLKGMDMALSKLNQGGWVHIFPEGSRSRDGGRTMGSAKRGVGRLVMDADNIPIVLPFVHTGMQDIMPIGTHFPKIGKMVTVLIGDPIHFDDLLLNNDDAQHISRGTLYDAVSSRIGQRLHELKIQVERLALEQLSEVRDYSLQNTKRANGILQQVDWEAFGMGSYVFTDDNSPSLKQAIQTLTKPHLDQSQGAAPPNWHVRMGFSYEGGIVSRIRGYMNPSELMGFAVKGLFMNGRTSKENPISIREVRPLKAWKQYLEGNIFQQWNCM